MIESDVSLELRPCAKCTRTMSSPVRNGNEMDTRMPKTSAIVSRMRPGTQNCRDTAIVAQGICTAAIICEEESKEMKGGE